jgi:hypothetical protein
MIWTICDDSGVEVETSVERFFEPTSVLCWLSDRLYRYINDGSHFPKPSALELNRQINFFWYLPTERTKPKKILRKRTSGSFMKTTGFLRVLKHQEPEVLFKKSKNYTTMVET